MQNPQSSRARTKLTRTAAVILTLAVAVSTLVVPSVTSATTLAEPHPSVRGSILASKPQGYVSALWGRVDNPQNPGDNHWLPSADGHSEQAKMPGNVPNAMTFSTPDDSRAIESQSRGNVWFHGKTSDGFALPVSTGITNETWRWEQNQFADCLSVSGVLQTRVGFRQECRRDYATIEFDRPQVNPVIVFRGGAGARHSTIATNVGCSVGWNDLRFEAINGELPAPGQVSLLDTKLGDPFAVSAGTGLKADVSFNGIDLVRGPLPEVSSEAGSCGPEHYAGIEDPRERRDGYFATSAFAIKGLVSRVDFAIPYHVEIVKEIPDVRGVIDGFYVAGFGFTFPSADLSVRKTAPRSVYAGQTLNWDVTVGNSATSADSHGLTLKDVVPEGVTKLQLVSGPPGCQLVGRDLSCSLVPDGYSLTESEVPSYLYLDAAGTDPTAEVPSALGPGESFTVKLSALVPPTTPAGTVITNESNVAGADLDPNINNNTATASTTVLASPWSLDKKVTVGGEAPPGGVVAPNDVLSYTVTANATARVDGVVLTDILTDVLKADRGATFVPGSAQLKVGNAAAQRLPDPDTSDPSNIVLRSPAFSLNARQTATLTYQVTVNSDAWLSSFTNTVTGLATQGIPHCVSCTTTSITNASVRIQKHGYDDAGDMLPIPGAAFQILFDKAGTPGDPHPAKVNPIPTNTGRYEVARGLAPGKYWLQETAAPKGHVLLAEPVRFEISPGGELTLLDPKADSRVTISEGVITVIDVRALPLPDAGSPVHWWPIAGAAVFSIALLLTLASRLRKLRAATQAAQTISR